MSNADLELMQRMSQEALSTSGPVISAAEFDASFDAGEDVMAHVNEAEAMRPSQKLKRVNVDFPLWMVESLDREAQHLGVTRQALVKVWIANCLTHEAHTVRR